MQLRVLIVLSIALAACTSPEVAGRTEPLRLAGDTAVYSLTWINAQSLAVTYDPDPTQRHLFSSRLGIVNITTSTIEPLMIPSLPICSGRVGFSDPERATDTSLAYVATCETLDPPFIALYLGIYDFTMHESSPLVPYVLPSIQVGTGGFSWSVSRQRGITSDGNGRGIAEQLYWIEPDQPVPLDLGLPQAYSPRWSPMNDTIAFVGAPEQGRSGVDRLDAAYNLYLYDPTRDALAVLVSPIRHPGKMDWSPDGRQLVVEGILGNWPNAKDGLWLIDAESGQLELLRAGNFGSVAWSPDGQQIAAIEYRGHATAPSNTIVIMQLDP